MNKPYPFWIKGPAILGGVALLFILLYYGKFILMPLAFAALFAMLLEPISNWLQQYKFNRIAAIITSMFFLGIILAGIISLLSIQLVQFADQLPEANQKIQAVSSDIVQFFENQFNISPDRQIAYFKRGLETVVNKSGQYVTTALGATTNVFTTLGLLPFFVFFMMYYKKMYRTFLHKLWDGKNEAIDSVIDGIQNVTQNYIIGMITVITLLAILNAIGLWIVGIKHVLFFAIFAAILAVIPYIGIIIGSLPAIIYALLFTNSLLNPLGVVAVFAVVQFLEGNFITPNVIGSRVSINPFMALIALIVGGKIWGIAGMILFVPFLGILKCIFDQVEILRPYGYIFGNKREYHPGTEESTN
ncbi:putative PurR-regulated permease PerM [Fodinibius salinus]|uniref:Putative PurR-regulated permease PerM n=1 Tax=Fodinibius salinus TaxID=860790 RepID=A0A5D3YQE3_9BACT|nr:AI-2E family transporter [Fodinibius salinus]TYP95508.1 putative PurR-regulated permease PerM [Fodinibius salinus]